MMKLWCKARWARLQARNPSIGGDPVLDQNSAALCWSVFSFEVKLRHSWGDLHCFCFLFFIFFVSVLFFYFFIFCVCVCVCFLRWVIVFLCCVLGWNRSLRQRDVTSLRMFLIRSILVYSTTCITCKTLSKTLYASMFVWCMVSNLIILWIVET